MHQYIHVVEFQDKYTIEDVFVYVNPKLRDVFYLDTPGGRIKRVIKSKSRKYDFPKYA